VLEAAGIEFPSLREDAEGVRLPQRPQAPKQSVEPPIRSPEIVKSFSSPPWYTNTPN
jgi:hypothetical protein